MELKNVMFTKFKFDLSKSTFIAFAPFRHYMMDLYYIFKNI